MSKEFTYTQVSDHKAKSDVWLVIHDKVYDATSFIDEHPGGEEVVLDVAGQDATEAFEDVGHSDEAREVLTGLLVGDLKREAGDPPKPKTATSNANNWSPKQESSGLGVGVYALLLVGGVVAFFAYQYLQGQQTKS